MRRVGVLFEQADRHQLGINSAEILLGNGDDLALTVSLCDSASVGGVWTGDEIAGSSGTDNASWAKLRLTKAKRTYGTGSLIVRNGIYFGQWRARGRLVKRRLGPVRGQGSRDGLTKVQAEKKLRKLMEAGVAPVRTDSIDLERAGATLIEHLQRVGRKKATILSYESILRVHLVPHFGTRSLGRISSADVEAFIEVSIRSNQSPKSVRNYVGFLNSIFSFAIKQEWTDSNPCAQVVRPMPPANDPNIHFLDQSEVEALVREVPADKLGGVEKHLYLAAVMTGMRQGELLALRWLDVDWPSQRIRVRRNFVRGEFGTPKSKRSSRSIPMSDRLGATLDTHFQSTSFQQDEDLVFAHPETGRPIDRSKLLKRFKAAVGRADVGRFETIPATARSPARRKALTRFHDLRHTFGTRMAATGVPMRTIQEWMGHRDFKTTLIYTDYMPTAGEVEMVNHAFEPESGRQPAVVSKVFAVRNPE